METMSIVEVIGLIPVAFAACVVLIHIIWVLVRDLIQENVDFSFLLDDENDAAAAATRGSDVSDAGTLSTLTQKTSSNITQNISVSEPDTHHTASQTSETLDLAESQATQKSSVEARALELPPLARTPSFAPPEPTATELLMQQTFEKTIDVVDGGLLDEAASQRRDSATAESDASTAIKLASGSILRSSADSAPHRHESATRWNVESGRIAPVGGLALTPPTRSPERPVLHATWPVLAPVSTVDRGCSPFRYSELAALDVQRQADETADAWRPPRPQCLFAKSSTTRPDFKTSQYRHDVPGSLGPRPTNICRNTNPARAFDYRRDAVERKRHLDILESNRTLEKFMRVLREERQARATAALFSTLCNRRTLKKNISFAVDEESRRPVTSSRAGTGSSCLRDNRPEVSTIRCSSPIGRQNTYDNCRQRHHSAALRSSYTRDVDEDRTKYRYDRPWHVSTPRPFS